MVVTYQSHCSVSANGTFDYIELDDKGTDIRIETQCCQPAITALNKVIFAQQMQSKTESGENLNTPKKPTVSVKMSAPKPLDAPRIRAQCPSNQLSIFISTPIKIIFFIESLRTTFLYSRYH